MTKFRCGSIIPSSCVPYQGKDLSFLDTDEQPDCDASIDDVFEKISDAIRDIEDSIDLSEHTSDCITLTQPLLVRQLFEKHDDKICALDASLESLQNQFDGLSIANSLINIDLGCLAASAAPCQVSTNTYTLIAILNTFRAAICEIKAELGI